MSEKEPDVAGKRGGGRRMLLIGAAVLLVGVAGAGAWFGGLLHHSSAHATGPAGNAAVEKPVLVELPDMVSNLDVGTHRAVFIKLHAELQARNPADAAVLQGAIPQLVDIFQTYLRSTRPEELHGGEGTYRLREALMNRIDGSFAPLQLRDLLFTQILVQ